MGLKEELKRQKEIREIELLEEERQRKVSNEDFSTRLTKKVIYYVRWFFSIMFLIATFTFIGQEDKLLEIGIGLVFTLAINPITCTYFKNMFK